MGLATGEGEEVKQISKEREKLEERKGVPELGSMVMGSTTGGSIVLPLAGDSSLAGDCSLAEERSLAGESSLGGVEEADGTSEAVSEPSW